MTPLARAGGIALSVSAHAAALALVLTLSAPDWTRPLFVDLIERAESIGGGTPKLGTPSGQSAPRPDADAPTAPSGLSGTTRGPLARPSRPRPDLAVPSATSRSNAPAGVQPAPTPAPPPDPRPLPHVEPTPAMPPPPASATPPASPSASASPRDQPIAVQPSAPSTAGSASDSGPAPTAEARRSPLAGGEARGGEARGRAEVRGDADSSTGGGPGSALALGPGGGAIPPEYGPYLQRFRRHVQESVVYPLAARRQSLRGTVELDVSLDPSGRVRDVRVARSSSYGILDDAAVDTLRRLDPLPLPDSLPRRPLLIRLPLVFDLR